MNENPQENPWAGQFPQENHPVPAPQYGQYVSGPPPRAEEGPGVAGTQAVHMPRGPRRTVAQRGRAHPGGIPVTWTIIALCSAMWVLQWVVGATTHYSVANKLGYAPILTGSEPWRMLTSGFVHSTPSPLHLLLNMYTLYLFGRMLEPLLGWWRMALLFLLSVLGGSVGVYLLQSSPAVLVIGASGGVFGLFGALFVFLRHFKRDLKPLVILIAINLAFGFLVSGVAWQAHVGGLVTGALVSLLLLPGLRKRF